MSTDPLVFMKGSNVKVAYVFLKHGVWQYLVTSFQECIVWPICDFQFWSYGLINRLKVMIVAIYFCSEVEILKIMH